MKRRALIAALLGGALISGLFWRERARTAPEKAAAVTETGAVAAGVAPSPAPTDTPPLRTGTTAPLGAREPAAPTRVSGADFSGRYADAMCDCTSISCVEEVRVRFSLQLGDMAPSRNDQAMKEAFARARACAVKVVDPSG